jgi:hypothetical protein
MHGGRGRTARVGNARERRSRPEGRDTWMCRVIEPFDSLDSAAVAFDSARIVGAN